MEISMSRIDYLGHNESVQNKDKVEQLREPYKIDLQEVKKEEQQEKVQESIQLEKEVYTGDKIEKDIDQPYVQYTLVQNPISNVSTQDYLEIVRKNK